MTSAWQQNVDIALRQFPAAPDTGLEKQNYASAKRAAERTPTQTMDKIRSSGMPAKFVVTYSIPQ